jgi:hypothetical protein
LGRRISSQLPARAGHKNLARRFPSIRGAEDAIASSAPELALAGQHNEQALNTGSVSNQKLV